MSASVHAVRPRAAGPRSTRAGALLLGLGRADRTDDGTGLAVVRAVRARAPHVRTRELDGDPTDLWLAWEGAQCVLICDAVVSGKSPGWIHVIDARSAPLPAGLRCSSSHALGLAQAIELARVLDRLPGELWIYGIEGADFGPGDALSSAVAARVPEVAGRVLRHLERGPEEEACTSDRFSPR